MKNNYIEVFSDTHIENTSYPQIVVNINIPWSGGPGKILVDNQGLFTGRIELIATAYQALSYPLVSSLVSSPGLMTITGPGCWDFVGAEGNFYFSVKVDPGEEIHTSVYVLRT
jgi:hypothetical protein